LKVLFLWFEKLSSRRFSIAVKHRFRDPAKCREQDGNQTRPSTLVRPERTEKNDALVELEVQLLQSGNGVVRTRANGDELEFDTIHDIHESEARSLIRAKLQKRGLTAIFCFDGGAEV